MENLTLTSIDRMTVVELRQKLEELKQEIGGSKAVLKLRLMNLLAAENPQNEAETNDDNDDNGCDGNDENGEERQSEIDTTTPAERVDVSRRGAIRRTIPDHVNREYFSEQGEYRGRDLQRRFVSIRMSFVEAENVLFTFS